MHHIYTLLNIVVANIDSQRSQQVTLFNIDSQHSGSHHSGIVNIVVYEIF